MQTLTARQREVLEFVKDQLRLVGIPPTRREIASHFGFRSVKAASDHINALRRKGAISSDTRRARSLRLVGIHEPPQERGLQSAGSHAGQGTSLRAEARAPQRFMASMSASRNLARGPVAHIPVYGSIPAGFARERRQEAKGCVSIDIATLGFRPTARTFALEVRGDSMIGRHILDGDVVILEHGKTPRNGDVVAALIDNESTLKTFVQPPGQPPHLQSENPRYPRLYPVAELVVQGVLVGLVRRFGVKHAE